MSSRSLLVEYDNLVTTCRNDQEKYLILLGQNESLLKFIVKQSKAYKEIEQELTSAKQDALELRNTLKSQQLKERHLQTELDHQVDQARLYYQQKTALENRLQSLRKFVLEEPEYKKDHRLYDLAVHGGRTGRDAVLNELNYNNTNGADLLSESMFDESLDCEEASRLRNGKDWRRLSKSPNSTPTADRNNGTAERWTPSNQPLEPSAPPLVSISPAEPPKSERRRSRSQSKRPSSPEDQQNDSGERVASKRVKKSLGSTAVAVTPSGEVVFQVFANDNALNSPIMGVPHLKPPRKFALSPAVQPSEPLTSSSERATTTDDEQANHLATPKWHRVKLEVPSNGSVLDSPNRLRARQHEFVMRSTMFRRMACAVCGKFLGPLDPNGLKCERCGMYCHERCKLKVPELCVATTPIVSNKNSKKNLALKLEDYKPRVAPFVPGLIVYCVEEIERRGLDQEGLYRISGAEARVNELLDRFNVGEGATRLAEVHDTHVICSCLKKFLRSLQDRLIPSEMVPQFFAVVKSMPTGNAASPPTNNNSSNQLRYLISELAEINRHTLAYLMLHLGRVADHHPNNGMKVENLTRIFGPTIVGSTVSEDSGNPREIFEQNKWQISLVEQLLLQDKHCWQEVLGEELSRSYQMAQALLGNGNISRPMKVRRRQFELV